MQVILDLVDHRFILLRLHAEKHDIALSGNKGVVGGGLDAKALMRCVRVFKRRIRAIDLVRRNEAFLDDSCDDGSRHVAAADETKSHSSSSIAPRGVI